MELEVYIAGIGGQGVQLMAKILALAALAEGRQVLLAAGYGFTMRGGSSLATIVLGNGPLRALPVVPSAGAAILLHHLFLETPIARLRPDALVVTDKIVADRLPAAFTQEIVDVDAAGIAQEIGSPLVTGSPFSAFAAISGLVATDSLVSAMRDQVPSYRRQHLLTNERAIRMGAERAGLFRPIALDNILTSQAAA